MRRTLRRLTAVLATLGVLLGLSFLVARYALHNFHTVIANEVYRSAAPGDALIERLAREKHLKAIIDLRGHADADPEEERTARRLGLDFIRVPMAVTRLPTRQEMIALVRAIDSAPRPMLIHCKSGADRTGVASAMAAMRGGQPLDAAVSSQLRLAYLHTGSPGEDVAEVFEQYRADAGRLGRPVGGWAEFRDYILRDYYPSYHHATINLVSPATTTISTAGGGALTLRVRVTNASPRAFPEEAGISLALRRPDDRTPLARQRINALSRGESSTVELQVPTRATGEMTLDLFEESKGYFSDKGSPPLTILLTTPTR
jgi:protein tyrosine/serine phosphatase